MNQVVRFLTSELKQTQADFNFDLKKLEPFQPAHEALLNRSQKIELLVSMIIKAHEVFND